MMGSYPEYFSSRDWVSGEKSAQISRVLAPLFALLGIDDTGKRWSKREGECDGIVNEESPKV